LKEPLRRRFDELHLFNGLPARVVFGAGSLQHLGRELDALGVRRPLILSTPNQESLAQRIARSLGSRCAGIHPRAVMHVPIESAREARDEARRRDADGLVAAGGGSTTGLGKAVALETGLPLIAIPTTYAGSEMTQIYGITEGGVKRTGKDPRVLPRTVIYDPELTLDLPFGVTVTSGINAIAHAAEGLYGEDRSPLMETVAQEGIAAIARAIPRLHGAHQDGEARADVLCGAWLCGMVLGNVGMALHHKLCHTLGGSFDLPHAELHTVMLPHALAFNADAAPEAMLKIAHAVGTDSAAAGVYDLAKDHGAPVALESIGMREQDLDRAAELAVATPESSPGGA
jgi:alcohol dehydrogenase class IV